MTVNHNDAEFLFAVKWWKERAWDHLGHNKDLHQFRIVVSLQREKPCSLLDDPDSRFQRPRLPEFANFLLQKKTE